MSQIADTARVTIFLADFAALDAVGKLNVIGAGGQLLSLNPQLGATTPQAVVTIIEVPPAHYNEQFALSVALHNESGEIVQVPQGPLAEPGPLRVAQVLRAGEPIFSNAPQVPRGKVWARTQMVLNFPGGLTVSAGQLYTWQAQIDGDTDARWGTSFFVPGPLPQPVIG